MSSSIQVISCDPGSRCYDRFLVVPQTLYAPEQLPLQKMNDGINEDCLLRCFVALSDNIPVGRCAVYRNPNLAADGKKTLLVGNYECADDMEVSKALLDSAAGLARSEGAEILLGPMNGSTWDAYRFCTNPEAGIFFLEPFHPAYYPEQWTNYGFVPYARYISTIDRKLAHDSPKVLAREKDMTEKGMRIRHIRLDVYEKELDAMYSFCSRAFASNFLYSPVSREVFFKKYLAVKPYLSEELVLIAEYADGQTAGFVFCFPDHACPTEKRLVLKTLARDNSAASRGLGAVLGNRMTRFAAANGYTSMIHALMHVDNTSTSLSEKFSGEDYKTYALFALSL